MTYLQFIILTQCTHYAIFKNFNVHSHYLILISSESLKDTEDIEDTELLPVGQDNDHPYYVTASVTYNRSLPLFTIGSSSDTIDPITGRRFYNSPLHKEQIYYYFIRAYSAAHTSEVCSFHSMQLLLSASM